MNYSLKQSTLAKRINFSKQLKLNQVNPLVSNCNHLLSTNFISAITQIETNFFKTSSLSSYPPKSITNEMIKSYTTYNISKSENSTHKIERKSVSQVDLISQFDIPNKIPRKTSNADVYLDNLIEKKNRPNFRNNFNIKRDIISIIKKNAYINNLYNSINQKEIINHYLDILFEQISKGKNEYTYEYGQYILLKMKAEKGIREEIETIIRWIIRYMLPNKRESKKENIYISSNVTFFDNNPDKRIIKQVLVDPVVAQNHDETPMCLFSRMSKKTKSTFRNAMSLRKNKGKMGRNFYKTERFANIYSNKNSNGSKSNFLQVEKRKIENSCLIPIFNQNHRNEHNDSYEEQKKLIQKVEEISSQLNERDQKYLSPIIIKSTRNNNPGYKVASNAYSLSCDVNDFLIKSKLLSTSSS